MEKDTDPPYTIESPFADEDGRIKAITVELESGRTLHYSDRNKKMELDFVMKTPLTFESVAVSSPEDSALSDNESEGRIAEVEINEH